MNAHAEAQAADGQPRLADLIWSRDQRICDAAFEMSADAVRPPRVADPQASLALRLRATQNAAALLQQFAEPGGFPPDVRILIDLPSAADAAAELRAWGVRSGFRVFTICRPHQRWSRSDALQHDCGCAADADALYAVRGCEMVAVSVFLHSTGMGGAERSFLEWGTDLFSDGYLVHVYVPALQGPLIEALQATGVTYSLHRTGWWVTAWDVGQWRDALIGIDEVIADLAEHRPDVMLTETVVVPAGAVAAKALGIPHIWSVHERPDAHYGLYPPTHWTDLGATMRALSDQVIANSRFVAEAYWPGQEVPIVAPIRLPDQRARSAQPAAALERDLLPVVGVVGSITPGKGQSLVLEAVAELRNRGVEVAVALFGDGTDRERARIAEQADELGVVDLVRGPLGWVPADRIYNGLRAVIVPSWGEGFGRIPLEAAAAGVPVVYSNSGGMAEFMTDGVTGVAFEPMHAGSLADSMQRLLADEGLQAALAVEALPALIERLRGRDSRSMLPGILAETFRRHDGQGPEWSQLAVPRLVASAARAIGRQRSELADQVSAGSLQLQDLSQQLHAALQETREGWEQTQRELDRQRLLLELSHQQLHMMRERLRAAQRNPNRRVVSALRARFKGARS